MITVKKDTVNLVLLIAVLFGVALGGSVSSLLYEFHINRANTDANIAIDRAAKVQLHYLKLIKETK